MDYTSLIDGWHNLLNTLSHGDSTVKGFIVLGVMGALGYISRTVPQTILDFIKRNVVASMTFTKSERYSMDVHNYAEFMRWFTNMPWAQFDRRRRVSFDRDSVSFGPGTGFHWFFHNGRYFWFRLKRLESSGTDIEKEEFTIYTFGRSIEPFKKLVEEFRIKPDDDTIRTWQVKDLDWDVSGYLRTDVDENLVIDPEVDAQLFGSMDWFIDNREWFKRRGQPYKKTVLLYGPPGCGKTSLVKRFARKYNRDLHSLNLQNHGRALPLLISKLKAGDILLIEDFDDVITLHKRAGMSHTINDNFKEEAIKASEIFTADISLSMFLNVLQGVVELHDIVIFLSTNRLWILDPAIYRKGRVDNLIEVLPLKNPEIHRFIDMVYEEPSYDRSLVFKPTPASFLGSTFQENPEDLNAFIQAVLDHQPIPVTPPHLTVVESAIH